MLILMNKTYMERGSCVIDRYNADFFTVHLASGHLDLMIAKSLPWLGTITTSLSINFNVHPK